MEVKASINFTPLGQLGDNGWNSVVERGFDSQLGVELAFKRIEKAKFQDPSKFFEEAQKVQRVRHRNIVEIKYACQTDSHIWMAMPLYRTGSVQGIMKSRSLTPREVIRFGIDMLSGLQHVHAQGLLHLDIKPANILLSDEGNALLADFGCARVMDQYMLADPVAAYPLHQVPERFKASKLGIEADIYQAGLTLYRMCNGDDLFFMPIKGHKTAEDIKDDKTRNKVNDKIKKGVYPDRSAFLPHIPRRLRAAIRKSLQVSPDDRFKSASEFMDYLSGVEIGLDWIFVDGANEKTWSLDAPECTYRINLVTAEGGGSFPVETTKTMKESGNTARVTKHCHSAASVPEALKAVTLVAEELGEAILKQ